MFICPKCNEEVADLDFLPPKPWWWRSEYDPWTSIPLCPSGHKLRSQVLGNLTELSSPLAFLRGFSSSVLVLALGVFEDLRVGGDGLPPLGLMFMTGVELVIGTLAFSEGWIWAGMNGPVRRLTSRAFGIGLGSLIPASVASHALYFHWVNSVEAACGREMVRLFGRAWRPI